MIFTLEKSPSNFVSKVYDLRPKWVKMTDFGGIEGKKTKVREIMLNSADFFSQKARFNFPRFQYPMSSQTNCPTVRILSFESSSVLSHLHRTFVIDFLPNGRIFCPFLQVNEHLLNLNLPARFHLQSMSKSDFRDPSIDSRLEHVAHDQRPLEVQE